MAALLDDSDATLALSITREIAEALHAHTPGEEPSLRPLVRLRHAMFYADLDRVHDGAAVHAERYLDEGLRLMTEVPVNDRLHGGIAGIGWTVARMVEPEGADRLCDPIDRHLLAKLVAPWEGELELLRGIAGMGLYALERLHREGGRRLATRVLDHLEAQARPAGDGLGWLTTPAMMQAANVASEQQRARSSPGTYTLGVAHGNAGVLGVLARYVLAEVEPARSRRLLEGGITFLLGTPRPRAGGRFAIFLDPELNEIPAESTRLAWCNGDLGIMLVLHAAGRALGRDDWSDQAMRLAHEIAARPFDTTGIVDGALCHGAAGVAHSFHRMYRSTGDAVCREAARTWFRRTLDMRVVGRGYGGYQHADRARADDAWTWSDNATLLSGSVGIGHALLAAATGVEPDWDGVLLFDCGPWRT